MSEQDARARTIAEQASKEAVAHLERAAQCVNYWLERINYSTAVSPRRQKKLQDIIQDALSLTADTARNEGWQAGYSASEQTYAGTVKNLADAKAAAECKPEIDCPACGQTVTQIASATLSLALSQHWNWACPRRLEVSK